MGWHRGPLGVLGVDGIYRISVVFTWDLGLAREEVERARFLHHEVLVGGPAVRLMPDALPPGAVSLASEGDWLAHHNPEATRTSIGCPRSCSFCAVPRIHGSLREVPDFRVAPIICDDNFLACSRKHVLRAIERLTGTRGIDFNQGLDARLATRPVLSALLALDLARLRFAWDGADDEVPVMAAIERATSLGFPIDRIQVYVLIGAGETPGEALYRCQTIRAAGCFPNVMRFQPLDSTARNSYLAPEWSRDEMRRFVRYWNRLSFLGHIPYEDFTTDESARNRSTLETPSFWS